MKTSAEILAEAIASLPVEEVSTDWTLADVTTDGEKAAKAIEYLLNDVKSERVDNYTKRSNVSSAKKMLRTRKDCTSAANGDKSLDYAAFYTEIRTICDNYFIKYFIDLYQELGGVVLEDVNECRKVEIKKYEEIAAKRRETVAKNRAKKK